ncbi:MAG: transporter ATP-binding protein [Bacteroidota bacterium]|nr:transporter ATP-binding protein [Bacteroidota bacterium]
MSDIVIGLKGITREFNLGDEIIHALEGINLDISKNEYVALMGPSGSGKSTLMNIIGCLDTPTAGHYFLAGNDVSKAADDELAAIRNKQIGFIFQTFNLIPRLTTLENVALPLIYAGWNRKDREERSMQVLQQVGLSDRTKHKPNELSGGQRQRVAVARALVNNPSLILADEPTGNLDTKTSYEIMRLFEEIHANGNTLVVVTHEEDIASYTHRIVRMRDGLIESDQPNLNIRKVLKEEVKV